MQNDIHKILSYARLAPSSHNTQPWIARLKGPKVLIGYDPSRHLQVGDPDRHELFMSLGCFIETFTLAAASLGYSTSYKFKSDKIDDLAELQLTPTKDRAPWLKAIQNRRSDRRPFRDQLISKADVKILSSLRLNAASVILIDNPLEIEFLADMTHEATKELMTPAAFRQELSQWVRHNWTKRPDGMPGYTQGMPGLISLIGPKVIKSSAKTAADQAKKDAKRVRSSVAVALVITGDNSPRGWIDAGRLFQRLWLEATKHGISASAISPAVISDDTRNQVIKNLSLKHRPVGLLRLGYAKAGPPKASPRRRPEQFIAT
ncbi:MAG TPA: nitroreductase family protein [Candidatus Saccharimonadales bacterium]|nr:nitroreductase family protein [Candidatus Saccharimonadales bacterium]